MKDSASSRETLRGLTAGSRGGGRAGVLLGARVPPTCAKRGGGPSRAKHKQTNRGTQGSVPERGEGRQRRTPRGALRAQRAHTVPEPSRRCRAAPAASGVAGPWASGRAGCPGATCDGFAAWTAVRRDALLTRVREPCGHLHGGGGRGSHSESGPAAAGSAGEDTEGRKG